MTNILLQELEAWKRELILYNQLSRGVLDNDTQTKYYITIYCVNAIIRELEELINMNHEEKEKFKIKNEVIKLYKAPRKTAQGVQFDAFYTILNIPVKGEENLGPQLKFINVYFDDVVDTSKFESEGALLVAKDKMKRPYIYEIRENGKKPYIYIYDIVDYVGEGDMGK